jgi:hypothetical protein
MKYVIFKDTGTGLIQPVLFADHTSHAAVKITRANPVSAGFFTLEHGTVVTYGNSDSLNLEPGEKDSHYISMTLINMGTLFFTPGLIDI